MTKWRLGRKIVHVPRSSSDSFKRSIHYSAVRPIGSSVPSSRFSCFFLCDKVSDSCVWCCTCEKTSVKCPQKLPVTAEALTENMEQTEPLYRMRQHFIHHTVVWLKARITDVSPSSCQWTGWAPSFTEEPFCTQWKSLAVSRHIVLDLLLLV